MSLVRYGNNTCYNLQILRAQTQDARALSMDMLLSIKRFAVISVVHYPYQEVHSFPRSWMSSRSHGRGPQSSKGHMLHCPPSLMTPAETCTVIYNTD